MQRLLTEKEFNQCSFLFTSWEKRFYASIINMNTISKKQQNILDNIHSKLPRNIIERLYKS